MTNVTDIRSKMTPNWIEKGKAILASMPEQDRDTLIAFGCYFGIEIDGNEVKFTKNTKLCLICAVKVRNILRAHGYKIEEPMVPGRLLH